MAPSFKFNSEEEFFPGQVIWCDHKDAQIDDTVNISNARRNLLRNAGVTVHQESGKIRPCLVVHVNQKMGLLTLAPFSKMATVGHPGWEETRRQPYRILKDGAERLWVGAPSTTPMLLGNNEMYWWPTDRDNQDPNPKNNLENYLRRRRAFIQGKLTTTFVAQPSDPWQFMGPDTVPHRRTIHFMDNMTTFVISSLPFSLRRRSRIRDNGAASGKSGIAL
ncbi:hypothetical protein B0H12DRAFT_1242970 [Mycena haematopus]|nr:hypothetical protein B0H12DRAFT_1242970 [Mycena haematopus]